MVDRGPEFPKAPPLSLSEILGISPQEWPARRVFFEDLNFNTEEVPVYNGTAEKKFWKKLGSFAQERNLGWQKVAVVDMDYIGTKGKNERFGLPQVDELMRIGLREFKNAAKEGMMSSPRILRGSSVFSCPAFMRGAKINLLFFHRGGDEFRLVLLGEITPGKRTELLARWQDSLARKMVKLRVIKEGPDKGKEVEEKVTFRAACLEGEDSGLLSLKNLGVIPDFPLRTRSAAGRVWRQQREKQREKKESYWVEYRPENLFISKRINLPTEENPGLDLGEREDPVLGEWGVYSKEAILKEIAQREIVSGQLLFCPLINMTFVNDNYDYVEGDKAIKAIYSHLFPIVEKFTQKAGELLPFKVGAKVAFLSIDKESEFKISELEEEIVKKLKQLREELEDIIYEPLLMLEYSWSKQGEKIIVPIGEEMKEFANFSEFLSYILETYYTG